MGNGNSRSASLQQGIVRKTRFWLARALLSLMDKNGDESNSHSVSFVLVRSEISQNCLQIWLD